MIVDQPELNYPADIRRRIDRRWQQRAAAARVRQRPAPIAPEASVYRGAGLVHHHWLCTPCGYVWTTVVRLPG